MSEKNVRAYDVSGHRFVFRKNVEPVRVVGHGAYGVVCCCKDVDSGEMVAVKKLKVSSTDLVELRRACREVKLLAAIDNENLLSATDIVPSDALDGHSFDSLYIATPFYPADLSGIVKSSQPLTELHVKTIMYQIMRGLKYLHSTGVMHRDLKPSNILVNADCELKICDLGLARSRVSEDNSGGQNAMTHYVVTRWYRAPELIMCSTNYNCKLDVWSAGCIFAELLARRPLFPGQDYVHQLELIIALLGPPSEEELTRISGNDRASKYAKSISSPSNISLRSVFSTVSDGAIDLLSKMLVFDPEKRISSADTLKHPFFADFHDPTDEPDADFNVDRGFWGRVDDKDFSIADAHAYLRACSTVD